MRIIAGRWRGRQISAPEGESTRPILDRAKTVLFDVLGNRLALPGHMPPVAVLDLFAGSGALGLEALSRGARFCLLVEQHRPTARLIRQNLDLLKVVSEARVIEADAGHCEFPAPPPGPDGDAVYELVFVDPPYRMCTGERPDERVRTLLQRLATHPHVSRSAVIVVRHALQESGPDLAPLVELERRDVGTMTLRIMTPQLDSASDGEESAWASA